ncbi:alpha-ketoglutarate-dependent dioxygenase AlkB-like [Quillaja saponaria]|uniref:Alpha-ketoglutarate-dependent dioxygenase AlkB-like n=1 Tax=Quillaja saponaria TaxID=32244 RepID=A0AAD7PCP8_QUISA|nr:alpha-ketoglutarate-dependent dioxygenase AlkB-like [Quillaja saponaria]
MLLFRSITLPSSFLCRIPLNRYISHRISPKFSSLQKIKKSKREAKYLSMEDSSFDGEITADGKLSDNSFNVNDDRPVLIMVGSIPVPVKRGMMANNTYEQSPSLASSSKGPKHYLYKVKGINNQPEFRSTPDATNEKKFTAPAAVRNFGSGHSLVSKRRTRIDLETEQNVVDTNSGTSFSFDLDISSSYDLENLPKNLASQQEELLLDTHLGKKSYPGFVERPKSNHRDSNSVALQKSDCSVSLPKFEPFDICLSGSRSTFMESTHKRELRPGMVLLKHYITHDEQVGIVRTCRDLGLAPGGFYQPGYKDGAKIQATDDVSRSRLGSSDKKICK